MATVDTKAGRSRKGGKWKLIVLLVLGLAIVVAAQTGIIGYGWARLKSSMLPRDEALLEYVPADAGSVAIIDPHRLDETALGDEQSAARAGLKRVRDDIKKSTDIDLAFDVDKVVLSKGAVVARGRFNAESLEERLIQNRYVAAEHRGARILAREGEDAIAVIGSVLLYGSAASIRAAIDAEADDRSLADDEATTTRLSALGWDRAALMTAKLIDDRPSVRAILTGATGPRAVTVGVATRPGKLEIDVVIETASGSAAEELAKGIEERRASAESIKALLGEEAAQAVVDVAKSAAIKADPSASSVRIHVALDPATQDRLIKAFGKALPGESSDLGKVVRLYQLLAPGLGAP